MKSMTVYEILEDFWIEWEMQELSPQEMRDLLIDQGCDPDAMLCRVQLLILEAKANIEMNEKLESLG